MRTRAVNICCATLDADKGESMLRSSRDTENGANKEKFAAQLAVSAT